MKDYYVLATWNAGPFTNARIVAGPLPHETANHEAQLRLKTIPKGIMLSIVEYDAKFGFDQVA